LAEIKGWREGLPGRGEGGGRPAASQQEHMREAEARLTREEALRLIDGLLEELPHLTRAEACGWMLGHWRD
jgi:hypothetical protein